MGLIAAAKLLLKPKSMGPIKKVAPTLGLKKTEAYKKSIEKTLNKAKIGRSQERIDAWWKKNKKKFE